jgi:hypothetical protein
MPEWEQINAIDPSPFDPATAYVAATRYKSDDFKPYMYRTRDYGKTWTKITNGIPDDHFTRVLREDPNHKGLMFAGTEFGIYVSYDGGDNWKSIQLNLPVVPITDLAFHKRDNELVVATQGRAFWIMDDLDLLWDLRTGAPTDDVHLFKPKTAIRSEGGRGGGGGGGRGGVAGANPPAGAAIEFYLKEKPQTEITLEFMDSAGKLVNKYSSKTKPTVELKEGIAEQGSDFDPFALFGPPPVVANEGMNRFVWDLRYADAVTFPKMILWAGSTRGPMAIPGTYTVKLTVNGKSQTQTFALVKDPRMATTPEDFQRQLALSLQIRDKLSQTNQAVIDIREAKRQLAQYTTLWKDNPAAKKVVDTAAELTKKLSAVEEDLYQVRNQANEDPLNYPIKINNRIASLLSVVESSDAAPTRQAEAVNEELISEVNVHIRAAEKLLHEDVGAFNKLVKDSNIPAVTVKTGIE